MKRWLSLMMIAGALLGLLGQEAAFAQMLPVGKTQQVAVAAQMTPECAEMMGLANQAPQPEKPCQDMTPDCIAKMGCAVPMALIPPVSVNLSPRFRADSPLQMPIVPLIGRDSGPEPHPPAHLG